MSEPQFSRRFAPADRCVSTPNSCSAECQHSDWRKYHRSVCKSLQREADVDEMLAMTNPSASAMKDEVDSYWNEITSETCVIVMRSAFHLCKPDQLTKTHKLVLVSAWDPHPETIRDASRST